jgi:saccharopine dehydrogenase-like NADP-dependent oxidoreductase
MKDCGMTKSTVPVSTWAPNLLWYDMIQEPYVYEGKKLKRVPPFSGEETYVFPDPIGPQPCYHHFHEEPVIMAHFIKDLRCVEFKMCGPSMPFAKALYDYGLAKNEPVTVKGVKIAPLDVFLAVTPSPPTMEEVKKMIKEGKLTDEVACLVVDIKGERKGKEVNRTFYTMLTLKEANRRMPGATATSYFVGIGGEVFTELLVEGKIRTKGVAPSEALTPREKVAVLQKLADKGIKIFEVSKKPLP